MHIKWFANFSLEYTACESFNESTPTQANHLRHLRPWPRGRTDLSIRQFRADLSEMNDRMSTTPRACQFKFHLTALV